MRIVGVQPRLQRNSGRYADRRSGNAVRKTNALLRNAVQVGSLDPIPATPHGIPSLLIGH